MKPAIRHISLDVWKTLIEPNPEFGKARLRYLAAELSLPTEAVEAAYREIKDGADHAAETAGVGLRSTEVYTRFMGRLGRPGADWLTLRRGLEVLFRKHAPIVRSEIPGLLRGLQDRKIGLSIASNTNFIQGECLHDVVLGTWGVAWDFQVFSDQIGRAKPHYRFWREVTRQAGEQTAARPHEILHVGDNRICDGGCVDAHIQFAHVNGPADLAHVLETALDRAKAA